jgi:hypothetical protein
MPSTPKKKCTPPRRWVVQRTLKSSRKKGHCQTFSKRKQQQGEAIRALTLPWVRRACHNEELRMNPLLPEELRLNLISFIKRILNPLDVPEEEVNNRYDVENIIDNLPKGVKGKTNTEYALSLDEFDAIIKEIYPAVTFAEGVLERFHRSAEVYLSKLIKGGAKLTKEEEEKTLQPKYTNRVRLAIFPVND